MKERVKQANYTRDKLHDHEAVPKGTVLRLVDLINDQDNKIDELEERVKNLLALSIGYNSQIN